MRHASLRCLSWDPLSFLPSPTVGPQQGIFSLVSRRSASDLAEEPPKPVPPRVLRGKARWRQARGPTLTASLRSAPQPRLLATVAYTGPTLASPYSLFLSSPRFSPRQVVLTILVTRRFRHARKERDHKTMRGTTFSLALGIVIPLVLVYISGVVTLCGTLLELEARAAHACAPGLFEFLSVLKHASILSQPKLLVADQCLICDPGLSHLSHVAPAGQRCLIPSVTCHPHASPARHSNSRGAKSP